MAVTGILVGPGGTGGTVKGGTGCGVVVGEPESGGNGDDSGVGDAGASVEVSVTLGVALAGGSTVLVAVGEAVRVVLGVAVLVAVDEAVDVRVALGVGVFSGGPGAGNVGDGAGGSVGFAATIVAVAAADSTAVAVSSAAVTTVAVASAAAVGVLPAAVTAGTAVSKGSIVLSMLLSTPAGSILAATRACTVSLPVLLSSARVSFILVCMVTGRPLTSALKLSKVTLPATDEA